ncbi:MAG: hypothetical protein Ct9H300mP1_05560 [Planctomycetaceae bacterium]|nr:MAG: hypothetical protein Ct9H300mP1_05560 [Planctomycetaceae bacterium]
MPMWRGIVTASARQYRGRGAWTAEIAIPLSELGDAAAGKTWRLNVARFDKRPEEISSFSPLFERLEQPEAWSSLKFADDSALLTRAEKRAVSIDPTPLARKNYDIKSDGHPIVFANSYLRRGSYTTLPVTDDSRQVVKLAASLGEYEPATFSVRATGRALGDVRAQVIGDLKNARGDVIPAKNVEIRVIELWRRQMNSRQHMYMERFLEKQTGLDIPRHTTRRFWLTVHFPPNRPPREPTVRTFALRPADRRSSNWNSN